MSNCHISSRAGADAAKLRWEAIKSLFEDAHADILLILDTCAIPDPPASGSHGTKQGLAASAADQHHRDQNVQSFTADMIEVLRRLHGGRPFTIKRLYEELVSQKQLQISQDMVSSNAATRDSADKLQLPVFFTLTPGNRQFLALAPVPTKTAAFADNECSTTDSLSYCRQEDQLIDPGLAIELRFDQRVLVCTTFVGDASPDMSFFNQWLRDSPALASKIAVEGMFLGPPTMLLISMPLAIWNVVQHDKVCCFLGYVSSHNMKHVYEKLVGPAMMWPSPRRMEDESFRPGARKLAAEHDTSQYPNLPSSVHSLTSSKDSKPNGHDQDLLQQTNRPQLCPHLDAQTSKEHGDESAEIQEAAEQLEALSHERHPSDVTAAVQRRRTILPDKIPDAVREREILFRVAGERQSHEQIFSTDLRVSRDSKSKSSTRSVMKQETRCGQCSHAPFKDSSSLRKHVNAAHTRPFPCAFSFAGCTSTFGSKNEWKRHIASQHLCLQYYRCSDCPQSSNEGKGNEFNRKDLFTQHLRRMHAPFQIKRANIQGHGEMKAQWEAHVRQMQQSCLFTRRQPPQRASCPKLNCGKEFEGKNAWDEWSEHVGRHMEKDEASSLGADGLLSKWALDEGIIERMDNGHFRLCATNGLVSSTDDSSGPPLFIRNGPFTDGNGFLFRRKNPRLLPRIDSSQLKESSVEATKPVETEGQSSQVTVS